MAADRDTIRLLLSLRQQIDAALAQLGTRKHSPDFASVFWEGQSHAFTGAQSHVVRTLWEANANGTPEVKQETLLEAAGSESGRLVDLFKDHEAWGVVIVPGRARGTYRLAGEVPA